MQGLFILLKWSGFVKPFNFLIGMFVSRQPSDLQHCVRSIYMHATRTPPTSFGIRVQGVFLLSFILLTIFLVPIKPFSVKEKAIIT